MLLTRCLFGSVLLSLIACVARAQPMGDELLTDGVAALRLYGARAADGAASLVPVTGQPFAQAVRVTVSRAPEKSWEIQLRTPVQAQVTKGDVIVARAWLRAVASKIETQEVASKFIFELSREPYSKTANVTMTAGAEWVRYDMPFEAQRDFEPGEAQVVFQAGAAEQTFELGGVSVVNYHRTAKVSDFPPSKFTYAGREPDAPWRKAAQERIERLRKADMRVEVTDASGKPVADATVEVKMARHAFPFGTAVHGDWVTGKYASEPDAAVYRDFIPKVFNAAVLEGETKWYLWDRPHLRQQAIDTIGFLRAHDVAVRGHVLVWPKWRFIPTDVKSRYEQVLAAEGVDAAKAELRKMIADHIADIAGYWHGKLTDWDVLNEPYGNTDLQAILGDEAMADWFKLARAATPGTPLYFNDYALFADNPSHHEAFFNTAKFLLDHGAPVDGLGAQSHFGLRPMAPTAVLSLLDRFGQLGLPIKITEFDFATADEQLQADYTRDFMTAVFSHERVDGFMIWGFWAGRHWTSDGAMWRKDWSIKPAGQAYLDLIFGQWWTNERATTAADGTAVVRGFLGEHWVVVKHDGRTMVVRHELPKGGAIVRIQL